MPYAVCRMPYDHMTERIMQTKINRFEIPTTDFSRTVKFYETVCGSKVFQRPWQPLALCFFSGI